MAHCLRFEGFSGRLDYLHIGIMLPDVEYSNSKGLLHFISGITGFNFRPSINLSNCTD